MSLLSLSLTLLLFTALASASSPSSSNSSVYDILPQYGLPPGLLPNSVVSYTLSEDDGRFVVVLEKPCYVQFDNLVHYEKKITGKLGYGSITDLKGVRVQKFLLWFNVDEIRVDLPPSDNIYFQVGIINKKVDIDQFQTIHSCRDGVSVSCDGSSKHSLELPAPLDEIEMFVTE